MRIRTGVCKSPAPHTKVSRCHMAGEVLAGIAGVLMLIFATAAVAQEAATDTAAHPPTTQACENCHAPQRIPIADPQVLAHSVHAKLQCVECHSDINAIPHPQELKPVDCTGCHRRQAHQLRQGMHAPLAERSDHPKRNPPYCTNCHGTHDVPKTDSALFRDSIPQRCSACHPRHYQGYMDWFHGQAAKLGLAKAPRCSDCHNPHRPLPASDSHSRVAPANRAETCGQCHKGVNANFIKFDPHPEPWNREHSELVYYSQLFMGLLLFGVFAFFGLHTVLWLQRSIVGMLRGEIKRHPVEGPYVQRFSVFQRWLHVTVIISFMLLALTGMTLKYAASPWAQWFNSLIGGETVRHYIHIAMAIVMFGYFVVHLGVVGYRVIVKRETRLLFGVDSMVPRGQDFIDMARNFAWFLYLRPKPRLDRWTYWEKFDYWAVFWGMTMIGLSGLMLANPTLSAHILPGQALNVAIVLHSEEALLAIGYIFIFHFIHNHGRPETFPLDISIFTGRVPLERFKDERQEQYQRLVDEGKLESMMVPPPSQGLVVIANLFGTFMVIVGISLLISVLYSVLSSLGG